MAQTLGQQPISRSGSARSFNTTFGRAAVATPSPTPQRASFGTPQQPKFVYREFFPFSVHFFGERHLSYFFKCLSWRRGSCFYTILWPLSWASGWQRDLCPILLIVAIFWGVKKVCTFIRPCLCFCFVGEIECYNDFFFYFRSLQPQVPQPQAPPSPSPQSRQQVRLENTFYLVENNRNEILPTICP